MSPPFRLEPEASDEIEAAALWYEEKRTGLGRDFLESFEAVLDRIARWPHAGAPVPDVAREFNARRVPLGRFPYHVVYLALPNETRIIAVAHDRRSPGYWRARSSK